MKKLIFTAVFLAAASAMASTSCNHQNRSGINSNTNPSITKSVVQDAGSSKHGRK